MTLSSSRLMVYVARVVVCIALALLLVCLFVPSDPTSDVLCSFEHQKFNATCHILYHLFSVILSHCSFALPQGLMGQESCF